MKGCTFKSRQMEGRYGFTNDKIPVGQVIGVPINPTKQDGDQSRIGVQIKTKEASRCWTHSVL
jgi:hypothetical protein